MDSVYYNKYIKYKTKYFDLKQKGGMFKKSKPKPMSMPLLKDGYYSIEHSAIKDFDTNNSNTNIKQELNQLLNAKHVDESKINNFIIMDGRIPINLAHHLEFTTNQKEIIDDKLIEKLDEIYKCNKVYCDGRDDNTKRDTDIANKYIVNTLIFKIENSYIKPLVFIIKPKLKYQV